MKTHPSSISSSSLGLAKATGVIFVVSALLLVVPRFFIFPNLCSRGLECASLFREPTGPFRANYFIQKNEICGDLANMAHRPDLCAMKPENFQTDEWGYRNSPDIFKRTNSLLVFGDSFAFGQGMLQEDGPSEQLTRITGEKTYNGAGKLELNYLFWLLDHFADRVPQKVIYFHLERHRLGPKNLNELNDPFESRLKTDWETITHYNPLKIIAGKIEKEWFVPTIFPNRFEGTASTFKLSNEKEFLFLPSSVDAFLEPRTQDAPQEAAFFTGLQSILKKRGIELIVVLVPEKYTVYAHLLKTPPLPKGRLPYLDLLEETLKVQPDLEVVNLLPVFKSAASAALAKNEYIYWPDDTHWNSEGVKIMATEVLKTFEKAKRQK